MNDTATHEQADEMEIAVSADAARIRELEAERADLTEQHAFLRHRADNVVATMVWQYRALRAEETIAPRQAGPAADVAGGHVPEHANGAPVRDNQPVRALESSKPTSVALALGWCRWWRRVTGGG